MKKLFEKQLKGTQPLTNDVLEKLQNKTYFNGEEKQVGEVVLMSMLMGDVIEKEGEYPELPLKLITLNERHFNLFEFDENGILLPMAPGMAGPIGLPMGYMDMTNVTVDGKPLEGMLFLSWSDSEVALIVTSKEHITYL
jgi:hypothetical protein